MSAQNQTKYSEFSVEDNDMNINIDFKNHTSNQSFFKMINQLSEGKTAQVFLVEDQCGKKFAQKTFKHTETNKQQVLQHEIEILSQINHPNCNKIMGSDQESIYLDFLENGDLFSAVQNCKLSESIAKVYLKQLVNALKYLHYEKNIAHRDLKLENIMLDSNNDLVICDFGFAMKYNVGDKFDNFVGTELYMSPQIMSRKACDPEKTDVFALGVVIFCMLMGYPPYLKQATQSDPYYKFFMNGKQGRYWEILQKRSDFKIPEQFIDLINQMIDPKETNRPTLTEILLHPWMIN